LAEVGVLCLAEAGVCSGWARSVQGLVAGRWLAGAGGWDANALALGETGECAGACAWRYLGWRRLGGFNGIAS
jgi:hypothetical protein